VNKRGLCRGTEVPQRLHFPNPWGGNPARPSPEGYIYAESLPGLNAVETDWRIVLFEKNV
jgi:hypothetical protein